MIQDYVNTLIEDYFHSLEESLSSGGGRKRLVVWKVELRFFAEDTFRKWLASRSGATVNHLLDAGMGASVEQKIVKALELEMVSFFRVRWECYERQLVYPLRILKACMSIWGVAFAVLAVEGRDFIWTLSYLCWLTGGVSLGFAGLMFYLDPKSRLGWSKRFISHFFVEAEEQWEKLQQNVDSNEER